MSRSKHIILWFIFWAIVTGFAGCLVRQFQVVQAQTNLVQTQNSPLKLSKLQIAEWQKMMLSINYGAGLFWRSADTHAMLKRANWIANRLNLPIKRPIQIMDIRRSAAVHPSLCIAHTQGVDWQPDTFYGMRIYDTNIPGRQRIAALKIQVTGILDIPSFEFNFEDGQLMELVRMDVGQGQPYGDRFDERRNETQASLANTEQAYQLAMQWLAAVDVNLTMLEKSRLPHPVHQGEYQPLGASQAQPVYFVDWGTNYYDGYYVYKAWHTNQWHPAVTVELSANKELLELYVRDMTFYRDPPMLINNVWQLTHTPDPPFQQLSQNPTLRFSLALSEPEWLYYSNAMCVPLSVLTNGIIWKAQHNLLPERAELEYSNSMQYIHDATNNP